MKETKEETKTPDHDSLDGLNGTTTKGALDALGFLDRVVSQVKLNREETVLVINAVKTIKTELEK